MRRQTQIITIIILITIVFTNITIYGKQRYTDSKVKDYYHQLTDKEKSYYNLLKKRFNNNPEKATGKVSLKSIKVKKKQAMSILKAENRTMQRACVALCLEHPEIYWVKGITVTGSCHYKKGYANKFKLTYKISDIGPHSRRDVKRFKARLKNVIKHIKNKTYKKGKRKKIEYINKWMVTKLKYSNRPKKIGESAYGLLIKKKGDYQGYSFLFKLICSKLKIKCLRIDGNKIIKKKGKVHSWNYVKIKKKWYGIDVALNKTNKDHFKYLLNNKVFIKTHKYNPCLFTENHLKIFKIPKLAR